MLYYWSLVVGPSLDVGTWNLVLKRIVGGPLVIRFASRQFTSADRFCFNSRGANKLFLKMES
jgi:hypothetical protein